MSRPDFVVVGHIVRDIVPDGWRLGGTATFAAVQAVRLGVQTGVVTRSGPEVDVRNVAPGVQVAGNATEQTTSFMNEYEGAQRSQTVRGRAEEFSLADIPLEWLSSPTVLLGPVFGEVPASLASSFSGPLVAVSAQGWLREIDPDGRVQRRAWKGPPFWRGAKVLFVSDEDVGEAGEDVAKWTAEVPIVAFTTNRLGARIHADGQWRAIPAFPALEVDPTGAGDVFATAFLIRLGETDDVAASARFASAAAACAVEAPGIEAIGTRGAIEDRMTRHPEVVLR